MPSSLSHAMVALAGGAMIAPRTHLRAFLIVGAVCAVLPDIDAIGRVLPLGGVVDLQFFGGHRGFTHSLTFAASAGAIIATATLPSHSWEGHRVRLMLYLAFATAAHGVLDTLTSIGATTSPVQFFSPFSTKGYTAAWHPIHGGFGELFLCLLPLLLITRSVWRARRLPWPRRSIDRPVTLGLHDSPAVTDASDVAIVRRWICFGFLVLLAFWGWRSEARLAEASRSGSSRAVELAPPVR